MKRGSWKYVLAMFVVFFAGMPFLLAETIKEPNWWNCFVAGSLIAFMGCELTISYLDNRAMIDKITEDS